MGVKFGTEEGTSVPSYSVPNLTPPHRCNNKGIGPPKLKFLLKCDQNVEYRRPTGAYPLRYFHKIYRICTRFHAVLAFKISLYLLKGLWSYGGFKLTGSGYPQIFSAPSGKTVRQTPKVSRCKNVLEVLYHHAKFGGARISPAAGAAKNVEFFVCLSVCLSVRHAFERDCAPDFAIKALEYRNDFDAVG